MNSRNAPMKMPSLVKQPMRLKIARASRRKALTPRLRMGSLAGAGGALVFRVEVPLFRAVVLPLVFRGADLAGAVFFPLFAVAMNDSPLK